MNNAAAFEKHGKALSVFADEVLRWNRRINLVSRQDTEILLADLFRQCVGGASALWDFLGQCGWLVSAGDNPLVYFDLGSGGGFPGVVWHERFSHQTPGVHTFLVEPRDKRAWFLERVSGLFSDLGAPPFSVQEARWGNFPSVFPDSVVQPLVIISLKALRLTDQEVLSGLARALQNPHQPKVAIARFYPAHQVLDEDLANILGIPPEGTAAEVPGGGAMRLVAAGSKTLSWSSPGPREACLVLSLYSSSDS